MRNLWIAVAAAAALTGTVAGTLTFKSLENATRPTDSRAVDSRKAATQPVPESKPATTKTGELLTTLEFATRLEDLELFIKPGDRPLVVNYWATWCGPCVDELPYFAETAAKYAGKIEFRFVTWDRLDNETPDETIRKKVDRVRARTGIYQKNMVGPADIEGMAKRLKLLSESVPQTFIFTKDGARVWSYLGEISEGQDRTDFEKALDAALVEGGKK